MDIVLLHPEIPHNTGAIGRLCVGLGWPLHIIRPMGFEIDASAMMKMMGSFTVLRLTSLMGAANVSISKEQLLALNAQLNQIKK